MDTMSVSMRPWLLPLRDGSALAPGSLRRLYVSVRYVQAQIRRHWGPGRRLDGFDRRLPIVGRGRTGGGPVIPEGPRRLASGVTLQR